MGRQVRCKISSLPISACCVAPTSTTCAADRGERGNPFTLRALRLFYNKRRLGIMRHEHVADVARCRSRSAECVGKNLSSCRAERAAERKPERRRAESNHCLRNIFPVEIHLSVPVAAVAVCAFARARASTRMCSRNSGRTKRSQSGRMKRSASGRIKREASGRMYGSASPHIQRSRRCRSNSFSLSVVMIAFPRTGHTRPGSSRSALTPPPVDKIDATRLIGTSCAALLSPFPFSS